MSSNIILIDCEDDHWNGSLLSPYWIVFDSKHKFKLSVKRDIRVSVEIIEINGDTVFIGPLNKLFYKFNSHEIWSNGVYYFIEETLLTNTDDLRFINVRVNGEGNARIIFEQLDVGYDRLVERIFNKGE